MKIIDIINETPSIGSTINVTKDGVPVSIKFDTLPYKPQMHHITQELKKKIPNIPEFEMLTLARELASQGTASYKNFLFTIQEKKPQEMKW